MTIVRVEGTRGREEGTITTDKMIAKGAVAAAPRERVGVMEKKMVKGGKLILKGFEVHEVKVVVKGVGSRDVRLRNLV